MTNFTSFFKGKTPASIIKVVIFVVSMSNLPAPLLIGVAAMFVLAFAVKRNRAAAAMVTATA